METKICTKCKEEKSLEDFNWKVTNVKRQSRCKTCTRSATNEHYTDNKQSYKDSVTKNRTGLKTWYKEFKSTLSCTVCSENRIPCLDFHHEDPSQKDMAVARAVHNNWSLERLKKEIEKCIVVCKNCHAMIHADTGVAQLVE